jgi:hypothetical protein
MILENLLAISMRNRANLTKVYPDEFTVYHFFSEKPVQVDKMKQ